MPTGIATDATTAPFFADLVEKKRLASLIDFENREAIFPSVHRSYKFALLTLGRDIDKAQFSFFLTEPGQLAEPERRFTLSPADIARINPNTRTAPVFRARRDAELTAKIYARVPVLIEEAQGAAGNPWGVSFATMFHMSNDSHLFRTARQLRAAGFVRDGTDWIAPGVRPRQSALDLKGGRAAGELALDGGGQRETRYVPLYEAKMIHHYDHRWASYNEPSGDAAPEADDVPRAAKADPGFEPAPRYWVPAAEVEDRLAQKNWRRSWLMGWRDICRSTDERTVIAAAFPRAGVGHTMPLFFLGVDARMCAAFLAAKSSLILDYVARQKVGGTHLSYGYLNQFPFLLPSAYNSADLDFIVPRVRELTYTSHSMAPFARDLGYDGPPFAWDEERRALLRAELDARIACLYGLTKDELRYILDPADLLGPAYPSETFRVLKENEIRKYGEYRTAKLVLEAWDRQERGEAPLSEGGAR